MSAGGVGPVCFMKSNLTAATYQDILEQFMLTSAEKLYGHADFILQQDLAPHTAKNTKAWINKHGITMLDWSVNSPDLNPIENLWGIVRKRPKNKELKGAIKACWSSIAPETCHKWVASMPQ